MGKKEEGSLLEKSGEQIKGEFRRTLQTFIRFRTVHSILGGRMYEVTDQAEMKRWIEMGFRRDRKEEEIHEDATETASVAIEEESHAAIPAEAEKPTDAQQTPIVEAVAETPKGQLFLF